MAKEGLRLIGAGCIVLSLAAAWVTADPKEVRDQSVADTLAVQTAMQRARVYLQRGDNASAVYVLESQLSRINGNAAYLDLLREAYNVHIRELKLANRHADVKRYLSRLQILDPGIILDLAKRTKPAKPASVASRNPAPTAKPAPKKLPAKLPPRKELKVRAVPEERENKEKLSQTQEKVARNLVARAEQEFNKENYKEAGELYEKAHLVDAKAAAVDKARWAYCKLFGVVQQLNQPNLSRATLDQLEHEVTGALQMAPQLEFGKKLLAKIAERKKGGAGPAVNIKHFSPGQGGWQRAETTNFRIYHQQSRQAAEQAARVAENTRAQMGSKWFGNSKQDWKPRCDLYLHATAAAYSKATGVPAQSPGHSSIRSEGGRVLARRIDVHCENLNEMIECVLPHETTHVVLAGQFGRHAVPRWADEGIAVLTEPRRKVDMHLANLAKCRQNQQLFPIQKLMELNDYPKPRFISAFYAQSVSLVEFLVKEKGPVTFTQFLNDGLNSGYATALQKHYGYRSFDALQQKWSQVALAASRQPTVASRR